METQSSVKQSSVSMQKQSASTSINDLDENIDFQVVDKVVKETKEERTAIIRTIMKKVYKL